MFININLKNLSKTKNLRCANVITLIIYYSKFYLIKIKIKFFFIFHNIKIEIYFKNK